jgi:superoxide dismutase
MNGSKLYTLPKLPYDYKALAPAISEEQLTCTIRNTTRPTLPGQTQSSENLTRPGKRMQIPT